MRLTPSNARLTRPSESVVDNVCLAAQASVRATQTSLPSSSWILPRARSKKSKKANRERIRLPWLLVDWADGREVGRGPPNSRKSSVGRSPHAPLPCAGEKDNLANPRWLPMTAEIVLLNREAVVLAADSAATIEGRAGTKIYHAENKLFTLSKYRPVGVMIYNAVQLCGVPWETIIKEYRKQLNDSSFSTLSEYADDFIKYLNNNTYLFPIDQQAEAVTQTITRRFREIREKYHESLRNHPGQNKPAAFDAVLQSTLAALERRPLLTGFDATFEDRVSRDFRSSSRILAEAVFARKRFPGTSSRKLNA